ncbi:MAG: AraC family transcriptional regulator ligand-binding domain-containing protein [Pseudomonadota bacterium]
MGLVSSLFAHKVCRAATEGAADADSARASLLNAVGIDASQPMDPKFMIPDHQYYALCERVIRTHPLGSALPLRVGGSMRIDEYGAFGLAWKTADNLRGSYLRAERYGKTLTNVSTYTLRQEGDRWYFDLHRTGERHLGLRVSNEQTIAAITSISREVSEKAFNPVAVHFKHRGPQDVEAHRDYFQCPVRFGADRDAIEVSAEALAVRNTLGDATLAGFFENRLAREVEALASGGDLARRTKLLISRSLSQGLPPISDVASELALSPRSLQRKLAGEGFSFQKLVDDARRELAEDLLSKSAYSLAEVAFLTGFSEQSAFTRAFKRWAGQTPRSFRLKN